MGEGGSPGDASVSGENEDRRGEEEQVSFKWKCLRVAVVLEASGSVHAYVCACCLASENVHVARRILVEEKGERKKGKREKS